MKIKRTKIIFSRPVFLFGFFLETVDFYFVNAYNLVENISKGEKSYEWTKYPCRRWTIYRKRHGFSWRIKICRLLILLTRLPYKKEISYGKNLRTFERIQIQ